METFLDLSAHLNQPGLLQGFGFVSVVLLFLNGSSCSSGLTQTFRTAESFSVPYLMDFHPPYLLKVDKKNKTFLFNRAGRFVKLDGAGQAES